MDFVTPLALSAFNATSGFVLIFGLLFPLVVFGLVTYAAAQAANERQENLDDFDGVSER